MIVDQLTSIRHDWETPRPFFDRVNAQFGFNLDAAASADNALCPCYFTAEDDALVQEWRGCVWCNPPYGYGVVRWVKKAYEESERGNLVVMLIPARTETAWWHDYAMKAKEIRLIRGRLMFGSPDAPAHGHNAPFPSALLIFDRDGRSTSPRFTTMDRS